MDNLNNCYLLSSVSCFGSRFDWVSFGNARAPWQSWIFSNESDNFLILFLKWEDLGLCIKVMHMATLLFN
jgi:hypothetical protein